LLIQHVKIASLKTAKIYRKFEPENGWGHKIGELSTEDVVHSASNIYYLAGIGLTGLWIGMAFCFLNFESNPGGDYED